MGRKSFIFIVVISFIYSCSTEAVKTEDKLVVSPIIETICTPSENSGYLGDITQNNIGVVFLDSPMPNLSKHTEYESQVIDQIVPQFDGTNQIRPITHLYVFGNEVMYIELSKKHIVEVLVT